MTATFSIEEHSHRRYNLLTGEWVQVSPHRARRPWQGQTEKAEEVQRPAYDPDCYLCPGNERSNGEINPDYKEVFVFDNDFAALQPDIPQAEGSTGLLRYKAERGICRVVCFSPRHDLTIAELDQQAISRVVRLWVDQCMDLGNRDFINYIQIFENKGPIMGCSNPHPHGQIWAQESLPVEPGKKQTHQLMHYSKQGTDLLGDYLQEELDAEERILFQNEHFVVMVPFWAVWPYESMIVPRRHMRRIVEMSEDEQGALAEAYQWSAIRYDNLF